MIVAQPTEKQLTLEAFLKLPETKPAREYYGGEIHQKPMPQGEHSILQGELVSTINQVGKTPKLAYAFPELRCTFNNRSIVPDISVFLWERIPKTPQGKIVNKFEIPPDWIIEILSPEQSANKVINKILFCLQQGTKLGWLIDPEDESILIFQPNQLPEIKANSDILPVLDVLKHWQLSVNQVFEWLSLT